MIKALVIAAGLLAAIHSASAQDAPFGIKETEQPAQVPALTAPVSASPSLPKRKPAPPPAVEPERIETEGVTLVKVPEEVVVRPKFQGAEDAQPIQPLSRNEIVMEPGANQIVLISHGHLNRIVTPFLKPVVKTTDELKISVQGSVIYLSTEESRRATLFIEPEGVQSVALSLTVIPRDIPPREIVLRLPSGGKIASPPTEPPGGGPGGPAGPAAPPSSYVDGVTSTFKALALGKVPQGYSYRKVASSDVLPNCIGDHGVTFSFDQGQFLSGTTHDVFVGVVVNNSTGPLEMREQWCVTSDVAAVAFWPRNMLEPGQKAEAYVLRRNKPPADDLSDRPSLVGG